MYSVRILDITHMLITIIFRLVIIYVIVMSPAHIKMPVQSVVKILLYLRAVTAPTSV
jgi:hypothetical protein